VSTFVEIAPNEYDSTAFESFHASIDGFEIGKTRER
jgi:hypothetical protein